MENQVKLSKDGFKYSNGPEHSLRELERYDFSNDAACDKYSEVTDIYKKTFLDVAVCDPDAPNSVYELGKEYSKKMREEMNISDPDSESLLLQEIYKILWSDVFEQIDMDIMRKEKEKICGDTMNSIWFTLNETYGKAKIETEDQRKERNGNNISKLYLLHRYVKDRYSSKDEICNLDIEAELKENGDAFVSSLDKIRGLRVFLESAHTLGNFIPVPVGCNGSRGTGALQDYWDLTLKVIYDYYAHKEEGKTDTEYYDNICKIVGAENVDKYKAWLDSFENWDNFVRKNYMRAFVNIKEYSKKKYDDNEHYGKPRELWDGHFEAFSGKEILRKKVLPEDVKQAEQFFERASFCIHERSLDMIEELEKRL